MRTTVRDRKKIWVAKRLPPIEQKNSDGYMTGVMIPQYDTPIDLYVNIADLTDEAEIALFGAKSTKIQKVLDDARNFDLAELDYLDVAWVGIEPNKEETVDPNYVVCKAPKRTDRSIVLFLESVET